MQIRIAALSAVTLMVLATAAQGEESLSPVPGSVVEASGFVNFDRAPAKARSLLKDLVMNQLPHEYVDDRKWGGTCRRWDGLKIRVDGLDIRTKRRWKEVNHGTWKKYAMELVDPDEQFEMEVDQFQSTGPGAFSFQLLVRARLNVLARWQQWNHGVRLWSASAQGTADVELALGFDVETKVDSSKFPPDVRIEPVANQAVLRLDQFKLNRISRADGPVVEELGDALEKVLRRKLAERNNRLVTKVNRQIEKNQDKLCFSMSDLIKPKWLGIQPPTPAGKSPDEPPQSS